MRGYPVDTTPGPRADAEHGALAHTDCLDSSSTSSASNARSPAGSAIPGWGGERLHVRHAAARAARLLAPPGSRSLSEGDGGDGARDGWVDPPHSEEGVDDQGRRARLRPGPHKAGSGYLHRRRCLSQGKQRFDGCEWRCQCTGVTGRGARNRDNTLAAALGGLRGVACSGEALNDDDAGEGFDARVGAETEKSDRCRGEGCCDGAPASMPSQARVSQDSRRARGAARPTRRFPTGALRARCWGQAWSTQRKWRTFEAGRRLGPLRRLSLYLYVGISIDADRLISWKEER